MEPGKKVCEGMTLQQIEEVIEAFGVDADNAKVLGFDGVEIYGTRYLVDQFL